ncbi:MAG: DUF1566 domain-containing protein [Desulfobacterales bacterium]|nr:DUF1566 domain-containing protein [Desulfobacterales bacterium]
MKNIIFYITIYLGLLYICCSSPISFLFAEDFRLPDTGQTACYDSEKQLQQCPIEESASFYGQDAHYVGPQPAYQEHSEQTLYDLNTKLLWVKSDDGIQKNWNDAVSYCNELTQSGYSDWRLPSRFELLSITNYGKYAPAINTSVFPHCFSEGYWTITPSAIQSEYVWYVDFESGKAERIHKKNMYYVRCVRSAVP